MESYRHRRRAELSYLFPDLFLRYPYSEQNIDQLVLDNGVDHTLDVPDVHFMSESLMLWSVQSILLSMILCVCSTTGIQ